jgi:hypothetical protein
MSKSRKMLVAIHGAGMNAAAWGGMVPHLLDHAFRPVSLPGHDPKAGGELIPTISGMADWVKDCPERRPIPLFSSGIPWGPSWRCRRHRTLAWPAWC